MRRSRSEDAPRGENDEADVAVSTAIHGVLADWRTAKEKKWLNETLIKDILDRSRAVIMGEPMLVPVAAPVNICGDIHGQIHDLSVILETGKLPPASRYLFLGDYVDRGKHGIECMCVLLGLKILYPKQVYLLRGNHESSSITRQYGFFDEVKRRFNVKLWKKFIDIFNCLPIAGLVEEAILCMHGGLSPNLNSLDDILNVQRPTDIPDQGLVCDMLWSDPEPGVTGWQNNDRGVSFVFGEGVVHDKLRQLDLDLVVRAHQVQENGYQFFAGRKLVTIFSATNYCGEFTNSGAMLQIDGDLHCSFQLFTPQYV
jgi:diadenosine tetraphosphatase ApaH/serine/threonine PP2A family protein phosphatase